MNKSITNFALGLLLSASIIFAACSNRSQSKGSNAIDSLKGVNKDTLANLKSKTNVKAKVDFQGIFEDWKEEAYKKGDYTRPEKCNIASGDIEGSGIPDREEIMSFHLDYNNDGFKDCIYTFQPQQCDGGNAGMWAQSVVLILSDKSQNYTAKQLDLYPKTEGGIVQIWGVKGNAMTGTYIKFADTDPRCCPSIEKEITISYPNNIKFN